MVVLSKEIQAFTGACEHLLSTTPSSPLSDDERRIVEYYIQELSNKYGAPKADIAGSAESCTIGQGDQSLGS